MLILLIYLYFITAMPVSKIWWFTRLSQPLWKTLKHQCHGRHYIQPFQRLVSFQF